VIDVLMDAPMAEVIATIPFPAEMIQALVERTGPKGDVLAAAMRCEQGDFPVEELGAIQLEAMRWASDAAEELFQTSAPVPA
jgi:EAL and modified HD-GYP domain-containing signal transduction protein